MRREILLVRERREIVDIGIIGTGSMGRALARRWAACGQRVFLGSRDAEKGRRVAREVAGVAGGSIAESAAFGPVVVLAVPWAGVAVALESAGARLLGKVLVDCTNPMVGAHRPLLLGCTTSGAEEIAAMATGARVVKAFNAVAARVLASADPKFGDYAVTIFHCGDDVEAGTIVSGLIRDLGYDPFDVGPLSAARYLEPLAALSLRLDVAVGRDVDLVLKPLTRPRARTSRI